MIDVVKKWVATHGPLVRGSHEYKCGCKYYQRYMKYNGVTRWVCKEKLCKEHK